MPAIPVLAVVLLVLLLGGAWSPPGQAQEPEYRIGPKDVLRVTVWGHDDLTRTVVVSADGLFPFPLIGNVKAAGLTPGGLQTRLTELLEKDYLVAPQVSVTVQEYRSQRVFVLGEADKPGTYPLTGETRLLDVLSQAGGPSKTSGRQVIVVRFPTSEQPVALGTAGSTTIRVNLKKLLDGAASENLLLQNGDTVYVPRLTAFFVLGEVKKPGAYAMETETTVLEAVTLAGGFTDRAAPAGAKVLRKLADGSQETIAVDLSEADPRAREMLVAEGDTLLIPRGNMFFVSGEVRKPGVYQLEASSTASGAITMAGGFTEKAAQSQAKLIRRLPSGEEQTVMLDLSNADPRARDFPLKDGDTVLVPTGNTFFVLGEVKKPGAYQMDRPTTATEGITLAGGFTEKAANAQAKLIRRSPSGEEQTMVLDLSGVDARARDFPLKDGDTIVVPTGNTFYVLGEVHKPGAYQLGEATTAIKAVALAGGFTEKAAPNRTKIIRTHKDGRQESLVVDLNEVIKRGRQSKDLPLLPNDVIIVPESFF